MGTINSSDRIAVTLYCLGTGFVLRNMFVNFLHIIIIIIIIMVFSRCDEPTNQPTNQPVTPCELDKRTGVNKKKTRNTRWRFALALRSLGDCCWTTQHHSK
jgi:hypothetical protein